MPEIKKVRVLVTFIIMQFAFWPSHSVAETNSFVEISQIHAHLFYPTTGSWSEDLVGLKYDAVTENDPFTNPDIPSNSFNAILFVVNLISFPGHQDDNDLLKFVVKSESGKILENKTIKIEWPFGDTGRTSVPFLIYYHACETLTASASLVGSKNIMKEKLPFHCPEE